MQKSLISIAGALLLAWLVAITCCYVVNERQQAVVLQFGDPVVSRTEPGLYFKVPLIQNVRYLPKTQQFWGGDPQDLMPDLPTKDGKKVEVTPWAVWRITDPIAFVKVLREIENARSRVQQFSRNAVRDTITQYDLIELVRTNDRKLTYTFGAEFSGRSEGNVPTPDLAVEQPPEVRATIQVGRTKILEQINEEARTRLATTGEGARGIQIVDVGIARIDFVELVRQAAFQRLIKFMESIASYYTNDGERQRQEILNRTHAEVQKIEGEGKQKSFEIRGRVDAEIIRNFAAAIEEAGEFYSFQRTLDAYRNAIGPDTRLILTTDNGFLQLLNGVEGSPKNANVASPPSDATTE